MDEVSNNSQVGCGAQVNIPPSIIFPCEEEYSTCEQAAEQIYLTKWPVNVYHTTYLAKLLPLVVFLANIYKNRI